MWMCTFYARVFFDQNKNKKKIANKQFVINAIIAIQKRHLNNFLRIE